MTNSENYQKVKAIDRAKRLEIAERQKKARMMHKAIADDKIAEQERIVAALRQAKADFYSREAARRSANV